MKLKIIYAVLVLVAAGAVVFFVQTLSYERAEPRGPEPRAQTTEQPRGTRSEPVQVPPGYARRKDKTQKAVHTNPGTQDRAPQVGQDPGQSGQDSPTAQDGPGLDQRARSPYPSPVGLHLQTINERVYNLAAVLEVDGQKAQALSSIMSTHAHAERALWQSARMKGRDEIDPAELNALRQRTYETVRNHPELGNGMAKVVERIMGPLIRDPGAPVDPAQPQSIGITELRRLASEE